MDNWVSAGDQLPKDSFENLFIGHLTEEHMWVTRRPHPYDIVSGGYINRFPKLYTHWIPFPKGPK